MECLPSKLEQFPSAKALRTMSVVTPHRVEIVMDFHTQSYWCARPCQWSKISTEIQMVQMSIEDVVPPRHFELHVDDTAST